MTQRTANPCTRVRFSARPPISPSNISELAPKGRHLAVFSCCAVLPLTPASRSGESDQDIYATACQGTVTLTRINCVPPEELTSAHLIAEYRELPRIFGLVRAAILRGERPDDPRNPTEYRLGSGHVRFFYARLGYLARRQEALIAEMQRRGYSPSFTDPTGLLAGIPEEWCGNWAPTEAAVTINRQRISERLPLAKVKSP